MASKTGVRCALTYRFSAARFTTPASYTTAWKLVDDDIPPVELMLAAMRCVTGHNFRIQVLIVGDFFDTDSLVNRRGLEDLVMQWRDTNLSLHPDFLEKRLEATTEMMANVLERKVQDWLGDQQQVLVERVFVHESDDAYAVA